MLKTFCLLMLALSLFAMSVVAQNTSLKNAATKQLYALFDETWETNLKNNPEMASYLGDKRYNNRWGDDSLAAIAARQRLTADALAKLKRINRTQLSVSDQLNYDLFQKDLAESIEAQKFQAYLMPVGQSSGIQTTDEIAEFISFDKVKDYEDWIARLNAFPVLMDQTIALMREGMAKKIMRPSSIMVRVPGQIDKQIVSDPARAAIPIRA